MLLVCVFPCKNLRPSLDHRLYVYIYCMWYPAGPFFCVSYGTILCNSSHILASAVYLCAESV